MMAGFLAAAKTSGWLADAELTCCSPHDLESQRLRFPEIAWLPCDDATRADCIARADVWLGLGDTPFQIVVGPWFLDHLCREAEWCQRARVPMFFLGVGVNEAAALDVPQAHRVLAAAERIWTRDATSLALLREAATFAPSTITEAADLAHLVLAEIEFAAPAPDETGFVLNFEDSRQFKLSVLADLVENVARAGRRPVWLVQECRPLPGSEMALHGELSPAARAAADVRNPDYAHAPSIRELLATWGVPGALLTTRYHAALAGAWMGAAAVAFARSAKVIAGAEQLGLPLLRDLSDPEAATRVLASARPADRLRLRAVADLARRGCEEFFTATNNFVRPTKPHHTDVTASFAPAVRLAAVEELESAPYRDFMERINRFASAAGLRTFTDWSKVWEYPWLWFHGLRDLEWSGRRLVDLGSEISPMPWLLASAGARVTLIETDAQWIPQWETLRAQLGVEVDWHLVDSERLPLPDASADVLTSFSVIEHQPDKAAALAEVARVLKPGGRLAISFDICEPEMGMAFPAWNGRALTLHEFETHVWRHPAFGQTKAPTWNISDMSAFQRWHLRSAPHHQYVVGAAVLERRAEPGGV